MAIYFSVWDNRYEMSAVVNNLLGASIHECVKYGSVKWTVAYFFFLIYGHKTANSCRISAWNCFH